MSRPRNGMMVNPRTFLLVPFVLSGMSWENVISLFYPIWNVLKEQSASPLSIPGCVCKLLQSCPTLWDPWTVAPRLLCAWDSPGKNTGVGCHVLLQGIFLTQRSNSCLMFPALASRFIITGVTWKMSCLWLEDVKFRIFFETVHERVHVPCNLP